MFERAFELFDKGDYRQAFIEFAGYYNESTEAETRSELMRLLRESYLEPNIDAIQQKFLNNIEQLNHYSYYWSDIADQKHYDELDAFVFPINEEEYYIYDRKQDQFVEVYHPTTDAQMKYFFENLDQPLCVYDEINVYNLNFLNDVVRKSEDVAADNHIYLMYKQTNLFEVLLQVCDLSLLLKNKKFVFLVGESTFSMYPINFKMRFGIDYSSMQPQRLQINEMQRICYWWKRGYSGSSFSLNVLGSNTNIVMKEIWGFLIGSTIQGQFLFQTKFLRDTLADVQAQYRFESLDAFFKKKEVHIKWDSYTPFKHWFCKAYGKNTKFTLAELLRAYFIYLYEQKGITNSRVVPVILFEPHMNEQNVFWPLIKTFKYFFALNCVRNPIQTIGRIYQREKSLFMYSDYALAMQMPKELVPHYYVHRFEDLKLKPYETCLALCKLFNVPYEPQMLVSDYTEYNGTIDIVHQRVERTKEKVVGYDLTPLYRNVDDVLSEFDQLRLKIFFTPFLKYYGYEYFDFDECPMSDEDIYFLLKFPFKKEKEYVESGRENITQAQLRKSLHNNMFYFWKMQQEGKIIFPKFIRIE